MKYQSKLGERGQVVIPKAIRDNLGLNKHSAIEFELKGTTITLKPTRDTKCELRTRAQEIRRFTSQRIPGERL